MIVILLTSVFVLSYPQVSNAQFSNRCTSQPLSIVKASGSLPPNSPSNVIDKDLNTRWSNIGVGSWIQVAAGQGKVICSVDIAWYRGNFRQNEFVISIWNPSI